MLIFKLAVSQGSFLICLCLIDHSLKGIQWSIISPNVECIFSMFLLGDGSDKSSDQSWSVSCLFNALTFFVLVSLDLTTIGSFLDKFSDSKTHTVGKWSLVSFMSILLTKEPHKF